MKAFADGVFLGLVISISVGPVFLLLVQTAASKGIFTAFVASLGSLASDVFILFICLHGLNRLAPAIAQEKWIGYVGVSILAVTGLAMLFTSKTKLIKAPSPGISVPLASALAFIQVLSINSFNPFVIIFWSGLAALINERYGSGGALVFFMTGLFATVAILNLMKVLFAARLSSRMTPRFLSTISIIFGAAVLVVAAILGFQLFWN
ncbi:MAG: LysE family transporter [Cyclobacteriaceae bacterium]|nr:LysE family transporter [Cyclobacteriaceae bacterium]